MPNLKPISRVVAEEVAFEQKRVREQEWFRDLYIADEVALERLAAWHIHLHEIADREVQQLAWQRIRDELNDKELQRVFARYAVVGVAVNGIYVDGKSYDVSFEQLRALDAEIAQLNRQIDGLANKISDTREEFWKQTAETIRNEAAISIDEIYARYAEQADRLDAKKDSLEREKESVLKSLREIHANIQAAVKEFEEKNTKVQQASDYLNRISKKRDDVVKQLAIVNPQYGHADTSKKLIDLGKQRISLKKQLAKLNEEHSDASEYHSALSGERDDAMDKFESVHRDLLQRKNEYSRRYTAIVSELSHCDRTHAHIVDAAVYGIRDKVHSLYAAGHEGAVAVTADLVKRFDDLVAIREAKIAERKEYAKSLDVNAAPPRGAFKKGSTS